MREAITMWKYTKMIVLVGLTAGVYVAAMIPFKPIVIIPGFTEVRPASVLPVVCSLLFGPAAAWGAAFGNIIGDFFGMLGLGSIFGAVGNFLYGYIPYRVWRIISRDEPVIRSGGQFLRYILVVLLACLTCGVFIGWGVDLLGLVPFAALGNIIWINNFLVAVILGPPLIITLYPRVKRWGLLHSDIMAKEDLSSLRLSRLGHVLLWLGVVGGLIVGNALSVGAGKAGFLASLFPQALKGAISVGLGTAPLVALMMIAVFLI